MTRRRKGPDLHEVAGVRCWVRDARWASASVLGILLAASLARAEIRLSQTCGITEGHRPGIYRVDCTVGGTVTVDGLGSAPVPPGGSMTLDVSLPDNNCVAQAVIPFPGGFNAPIFCIPGLSFTVQVVQTGCGIGMVDTDGGSDFTVTEVGDTSSPVICGLPHPACAIGADSNGQIDITVGDGTPDTCSSSGTGNAIVSVPVFTTTWLHVPVVPCPDPDGMPGGAGDTFIASFPQTLDFTTDTNTADWADLDPDGCFIGGSGPFAPGLASTGACIDLAGGTVTVAASGPVFSSSAPLFDLSFTTVQSCNYAWLGPSGGASCASPPAIGFNGTAQRCVVAP